MAKRELDALAVSALCENLALLLGAGIQLDEAAGLLCEDSAAGPFREAARTMQKALLLGESLSSAVEKTGALPERLPQNDVRTAAGPGDVMLYQGSSVVLFYGSNTWSYTKLAHITVTEGLKDVLSGSETSFTLSLEP